MAWGMPNSRRRDGVRSGTLVASAVTAGAATAADAAPAAPGRQLGVEQVAWLAAVPTALVGVLAIILLGPVIGRTLLAPPHVRFWAEFQPEVRPEPTEHGRYLVAVAVPLLLIALTVAGARLRPRRAGAAPAALVAAVQLAVVAFVVYCLAGQREEPLLTPDGTVIRFHYFTEPTLVVAAVGTLLAVLAVRLRGVRAVARRCARDTPGRTAVAFAVALAAIAVWLLPGFNTEATIQAMPHDVWYHLVFTLDETFAVLDGRSPVVNYVTQYGALFPYGFAAGMSLLGSTVAVFVGLALLASGIGMLAIFAVLRRAAGSSVWGLVLFLPVLATSFFIVGGTLERRYTFGDYFGTFPMRYAGPSVLLWVVAWHLAGARPRRAWPVFVVAGLVALNNADAGIPALGAAVAALLWANTSWSRAALGRLALEAVAGLAGAFALASLVTLVHAGSLPHPTLLLRFSRLFASAGFAMYPMPGIGLHLVLYLTFVAALGVATVRALRAEPDRLLTGTLAWSGVFGLGAGAYFVGRSTADDLIAVFFPWSLALALLSIPAMRVLAGASWRRPPLAAVAVLFGFAVTACSVAQAPAPWDQVRRLQQAAPSEFGVPPGQSFVAQHTRRGEHVAILSPLGHRIGADLGVVNVSAWANTLSMPAVEQMQETLATLRAAHGRELFLPTSSTPPEIQAFVERAGFAFVGEDPTGSMMLWVDRRPATRPRRSPTRR